MDADDRALAWILTGLVLVAGLAIWILCAH